MPRYAIVGSIHGGAIDTFESKMTLWREIDEWVYEHFDPDVDPDELVGFTSLARKWGEKKNGRTVPAWADFDYSDFVGWHGRLVVYEISYDPFSYVVRLSGVAADGLYGRTMTGATMEQIATQRLENDITNSFYEMTCRDMRIARTVGPLNAKGREFVRVTFMEFPLSDDGVRVTHTLEAFLVDQ